MSGVIKFERYLDYSDVFLIPQYSEIDTRTKVDVGIELTFNPPSNNIEPLKLKVPVISANMDTITSSRMAKTMYDAGAFGALHRFMTIEENIQEYKLVLGHSRTDCFVSVGVNRDSKERALWLYNVGARYFIIDIAHGHSKLMKSMIEWMKGEFSDIFLMAGNVATFEGANDLAKWGADAIKVGIGPGCFAAGTRILMSNGIYKNIEDIRQGDRIINKNGKVITVRKSFCSGIRKVVKYKTNSFYKETVVTPDHLHWIGDLSSTSENTLSSRGYARLLDLKSKTVPKTSKYKWKEIGKVGSEVSRGVLLLPRNIEFEFAKAFAVSLTKRYGGNNKSKNKVKKSVYVTLKPSRDLGYIFGTFLGDGFLHPVVNNGSHSNSVHWEFGLGERKIAEQLSGAIFNTFGRCPLVKTLKKTIRVTFYDKPFADWLIQFGKKTGKHLPPELLVLDNQYLRGLFEGLIDSDGSYSGNRTSFCNTSPQLIELYDILCYLLRGHFPLNSSKGRCAGGLVIKDCNKLNEAFVARNLMNSKVRMTKDHQVVKLMDYTVTNESVPVYDLEVECDTHSFIANNAIVHNSVCATKDVTGVTIPQFSAVRECSKILDWSWGNRQIHIVADGGIKSIGDIAKALGAGASMVMIGGMFSGCTECPGEVIENSKKVYRGMASRDAMRAIRVEGQMPTPEGITTLVDWKGSVAHIIQDIHGGLQSAFSYSNARNLKEFQENAQFGVRHF